MGGYDVIKFFNEKYNLLFSAGTIYSCLYSLERNGLVNGMGNPNKRVYKLTDKGQAMLNSFRDDKEELLKFISDMLR
jgi:DNA-binding PadR family transcriptional regulator